MSGHEDLKVEELCDQGGDPVAYVMQGHCSIEEFEAELKKWAEYTVGEWVSTDYDAAKVRQSYHKPGEPWNDGGEMLPTWLECKADEEGAKPVMILNAW